MVPAGQEADLWARKVAGLAITRGSNPSPKNAQGLHSLLEAHSNTGPRTQPELNERF